MDVLRRRPLAIGKVVVAAVFVASCKEPHGIAENAPDATATPSPQASAMPAPLANAPTAAASALVVTMPEGGPPPTTLRGDQPLPADPIIRETVAYTLSAVMKHADLSGPPRAQEVNASGIDAARKKTELRLAIELTTTRMRVSLLGAGWVLPQGTELRARSDRYGHVVVWAGGATYRPLAPGTLRALIGERRFDVAPVTPADLTIKDDAGKRIGVRTRKVAVATRAATATFELGRTPDLGEGGVLLCRMLLDLMNAPPTTPLCADGELPMRAELRWAPRGSMVFEVTGLLKRDKVDLATASLLVPPAGSTFSTTALPAVRVQAMLPPPELAAFRNGPVDMPSVPRGEGDGLVVANMTDELRVLNVDGVPVAFVAPGAKDVLTGLQRGRYNVQWRTFLGESFEVPTTQTVPGVASVGGPSDGGSR